MVRCFICGVRQSEPMGECPNCPPTLQAIGSAVPESAGYTAIGNRCGMRGGGGGGVYLESYTGEARFLTRRCVRDRVQAARGYGGPQEWRLTAALGEAKLSPEIRNEM